MPVNLLFKDTDSDGPRKRNNHYKFDYTYDFLYRVAKVWFSAKQKNPLAMKNNGIAIPALLDIVNAKRLSSALHIDGI